MKSLLNFFNLVHSVSSTGVFSHQPEEEIAHNLQWSYTLQ